MNPAYLSYPLPRAADLPPIRPVLLDGDDPEGPLGAKGIGEIVIVPTGAAIANAVAHATGVRIRELPLTPDRVLTALNEHAGRRRRSYGLLRRPSRWWIAAIRWLYPRGMHRFMHRFGTRLRRDRPVRRIERIVQPETVTAAVGELAAPAASAIAGGTDHVPARRQGLESATTLVDVALIPELGIIDQTGDRLRLGASVRLDRLGELGPQPEHQLVADAAGAIATPQIRSMATVAGNLCQQKRCWFFRNGFDCYKRGGVTCPCYAVMGDHRFYHAAIDGHRCQAVTPSDLATALSCLDATLTLQGGRGRRVVAIHDFYTGPGETCLRDDELVVHVDVPTSGYSATAFEKLDQWQGDFAIVSAAVALRLDAAGTVERAAISLGAVAPTPLRLRAVEAGLVGHRLDDDRLERLLERTWSRHGHPLPGNEWKLDAATGVVRRAVDRCRARTTGGSR